MEGTMLQDGIRATLFVDDGNMTYSIVVRNVSNAGIRVYDTFSSHSRFRSRAGYTWMQVRGASGKVIQSESGDWWSPGVYSSGLADYGSPDEMPGELAAGEVLSGTFDLGQFVLHFRDAEDNKDLTLWMNEWAKTKEIRLRTFFDYRGPKSNTRLVIETPWMKIEPFAKTLSRLRNQSTAALPAGYEVFPFDGDEAIRRRRETARTLHIPEDSELVLDANICIKFVLIPAGRFLMGSDMLGAHLAIKSNQSGYMMNERPRHQVTIARPFYMGAFVVTNAQYRSVLEGDANYMGDLNPVVNVSREGAEGFCKRMSEKVGKRVRLPTEAEWEYACRAGSETSVFYGDDPDSMRLEQYAWVKSNSEGGTHPVGRKKPNPWGLYDIYGNVWQFCSDGYGPYHEGEQVDPVGAVYFALHVMRGGSFVDGPELCRSASRGEAVPWGASNIGFRVVMDLE
jgi:formylglycine-generating enzyme required for sulfatase activity